MSERMHVISRKTLKDFWNVHPDAENPLRSWFQLIRQGRYESFVDVKRVFGSVDWVGGQCIFNIGGNKYRLIAVFHFDRKRAYVRRVLTHSEYDRGDWK
jgi:mRNA interferase HigB